MERPLCCIIPEEGPLWSVAEVKVNSAMEGIFQGTATVARGNIGDKAPSFP